MFINKYLMKYFEYVSRIGMINDPNMSDEDFKSGLEKFVADVIKSHFEEAKDVDSYSTVTRKDIAIEYAEAYLAERAKKVGVDLNIDWVQLARDRGTRIEITGRYNFNNTWNTNGEDMWIRKQDSQQKFFQLLMQRIGKIRGDNTDEDIYVFEFEFGNKTPGIRLDLYRVEHMPTSVLRSIQRFVGPGPAMFITHVSMDKQ